MDIETAKKNAGYKAASFVQNEMIVGLGTGSTAKYFIEALIFRKKEEALTIKVVASSAKSLQQALDGGLSPLDMDQVRCIDLTVDGADEIDDQKRMIKGGGGALLREKIVASLSKEMIVIIDESKKVSFLGTKKVPVEIVSFAHMATLHRIQKRTPNAKLRTKTDLSTELYITDNQNYIVDIMFPALLEDPEKEHALLKEIPGVVETGFFFHLAGRVIISFFDGQIVVLP